MAKRKGYKYDRVAVEQFAVYEKEDGDVAYRITPQEVSEDGKRVRCVHWWHEEGEDAELFCVYVLLNLPADMERAERYEAIHACENGVVEPMRKVVQQVVIDKLEAIERDTPEQGSVSTQDGYQMLNLIAGSVTDCFSEHLAGLGAKLTVTMRGSQDNDFNLLSANKGAITIG